MLTVHCRIGLIWFEIFSNYQDASTIFTMSAVSLFYPTDYLTVPHGSNCTHICLPSALTDVCSLFRFSEIVWVWQCDVTRGRLCPNHTTTDFSESKGSFTKVTACFQDLLMMCIRYEMQLNFPL